ncbi:thioredoxin family protein [Legionella sp. km772]|uniref:thioredoxin family protein n=1 Tax=Legionella sp. km772 TaxID=2498111 RepID=UPI000F8D0290|nr:thioredoxin family protein [Legionella sp. km772]RUR08594.1 thioredoxin [Legionella sp. km772]
MLELIKTLIIALTISLPHWSFANLQPFTNRDCQALAMPKTVLLVHASWCPHCKAFLPIYKQVSDKKKYAGWIFYQMMNDKFAQVCGTVLTGVPVTFKNNMKSKLMGNKPPAVLEHFLDSQ